MISRSHTEWHWLLKCTPTGAIVFMWHCWTTVPLRPLFLSFSSLQVSPMYWGCAGHTLPPLLLLLQHTTLDKMQVSLPLTWTFSPVTEHLTFLIIFDLFRRRLQTEQLDCQQGVNPSWSLVRLLATLPVSNLALNSISHRFWTLLVANHQRCSEDLLHIPVLHQGSPCPL